MGGALVLLAYKGELDDLALGFKELALSPAGKRGGWEAGHLEVLKGGRGMRTLCPLGTCEWLENCRAVCSGRKGRRGEWGVRLHRKRPKRRHLKRAAVAASLREGS